MGDKAQKAKKIAGAVVKAAKVITAVAVAIGGTAAASSSKKK